MEAKTLGDFLFIYEKFATAENKSPRTIEAVIQAATHFDKFLGGCSDIIRVDAEDLRRYIRHLQTSPKWTDHPTINKDHGYLSPHTVACYIRGIRSLWSWLKREGFIEENPFQGVKPPKTSQITVTPPTSNQIEQVLRTIPRNNHNDYRDAVIIVTIYGTGLRINELTTLNLKAVDFDTGQLTVMGKGGKQRALFMSPKLFKALFKYRQRWRPNTGSDYFFITDTGRPLTRFYVAHRLKSHAKRASIDYPRFAPHALRYAFAIDSLRGGYDESTLQKILGHSSPEMTRHYAQLADQDVERKMKAFSPAENLDIRM